MGCGGSKPLSAAEQRAAALKAAMKKAEKDQNARLDRRESLAVVVDIEDEAEKHAGTVRLDGVIFTDHYRVIDKLGEGAFGVVSKVQKVTDGKEYAAKEVLRSRCQHAQQWKASVDEMTLWSMISSPYHPSILQLIEVVYLENVSFHLVTEVMKDDLAGAFGHFEMSEQNARMITVQLAAAIAHLHKNHSMAHRDIKPENVLCRRRHNPMLVGSLKLADFGFCAKFSGGPKEPCFSLYAGSVDYFAPELAQIVRAVRKRQSQQGMKYGAGVDCYALGCVVFEMFNGSTPHYFPDENKQIEKIIKGGLAYPKDSFGMVSSTGMDFVKRLLEPDQRKRMTIEEAMRHKWLQSVHDSALSVQMDEPADGAARKSKSPDELLRAKRRSERAQSKKEGPTFVV